LCGPWKKEKEKRGGRGRKKSPRPKYRKFLNTTAIMKVERRRWVKNVPGAMRCRKRGNNQMAHGKTKRTAGEGYTMWEQIQTDSPRKHTLKDMNGKRMGIDDSDAGLNLGGLNGGWK